MTTWTDIPNSVFVAGKPGRAVDARALRDNPVAMAEGASGAPKITGKALSCSIGNISGTTTFTNLQDYAKILAIVSARRATTIGGSYARYRLSTDNGSTWGSYVAIAYVYTDQTSSTTNEGCSARVIDLATGGYNAIQFSNSSSDTIYGAVFAVEGA